MKKLLRSSLILATVHLIVFFTLLCISLSRTMRGVDVGVPCDSHFDKGLIVAIDILSQPMRSLHSSHSPDRVEWLLVFLNSFAWGIVIVFSAAALRLFGQRKGMKS